MRHLGSVRRASHRPNVCPVKKHNHPNRGAPKNVHPPQYVPTFEVRRKLRFQASSASVATITSQDLGDLWCVATGTTSATQLAEYIRVEKIEMWGPMASDLVPVTVSVDWTGSTAVGGLFGKSNRVSDTSMGSSEPAHVLSKVPPHSQIGQYQSVEVPSLPIMVLTFPDNTVIDLTMSIIVRDDGTATAVGAAVVGATPGANYLRSLDSNSTNALLPVSYPTI